MVEVAQKGAVQRVAIRGEGGKLNGGSWHQSL